MTEVLTISEAEAVKLMKASKGKLFTVTFVKRSKPGVVRRMTCRLGVRKEVTGAGQSFDPAAHSLLTVFEFVTNPETSRGQRGRYVGGGNLAGQYRNIPFEGIVSLKTGGRFYRVAR